MTMLTYRSMPFFPLIAGGGTFDPSNPTNTQVFGPLIAPWEAVDIWIVFFCSLQRRRDFIGESRPKFLLAVPAQPSNRAARGRAL
jgi:hypothetical protein